MGLFDSILDPGKKDRRAAAAAASAAVPTGGDYFGPGGIGAGFNVGPGGLLSLTSSLGSFDPILSQLLGAAGGASGGPFGMTGGQERGDLAALFQSALPMAMADPRALGAEITDYLRPGLDRAQGTLRNETFDRLFNRGQSAVSGAASPVLEGLQKLFGEQNAALSVQGLDLGRGLQNDALGRLFGAQSGIAGIDASNFQRGVGALSGAGSVAQLPLAFQNALLAMQGLTSESQLGLANVHQNNAAMAKSPVLEALKAAGSFVGYSGFDMSSLPGIGKYFKAG